MIDRPVTIPVTLASHLRVLVAHRIDQCGQHIKADTDPTGYWRDELDRAKTTMASLTIAMQK